MPRNSQQKLTPITSPWPFYKWGIDIAEPFSEGPGKVKFLIVAVDYFTKWIEAKPMATIMRAQVKKFVWDNIHPQANGLVERANRSLSEGIMASNEETPFSLTYGMEAVILVEIGMPTLRTAEVDMIKNDKALEINRDLLEERREQSTGAMKQAAQKTEASLDLNGNDHMKSQKHWVKEHISLGTTTETISREHGTFETLKNAMCMKCKHLSRGQDNAVERARTAEVDMIKNDKALEINRDLLEERREQVAIQEAKSKAKMEKYYNTRVHSISFCPGDLVYRSNEASRAEDRGKLGPKWE
nr:gypsy retrotransposon integrase-like protein 1 [Tanacetum cinerariifolium]